jgi:GWxTD domain-containing protein
MKIRPIRYFFRALLFAAAVLYSGCASVREATDTKDLSYLYNPLKNSINPRFGITNKTDVLSDLSIRFAKGDLYFNEANPKGLPMAQMLISIRLFNITLNRTLADTAQFDLDIIGDTQRESYTYKVPLNVEKGVEYIAEVKIYDKIREFMVQSFIPFNTQSDFSRYNFVTIDNFTKEEIIQPIMTTGRFFNVSYNKGVPDSLFISYFPPSGDVPYPPSMMLPEKPLKVEPDTTVAVKWSDTLSLMLPSKGIYHVTAGREVTEGITYFNFGTGYPNVTAPEEMIGPLSYLASANEMQSLYSTPWPKIGVDDFWLGIGGNVEKARELIRIFYTRVMYANFYFASYREGWRTDRGMIYIIYGPPDKIYKSPGQENWGYKNHAAKSAWGPRYTVKDDYLFFTFRKRDNLFTDNDFILNRSETVVTNWDQAVAAWRKGIVFRLDNPEDI